MRSSCFLARFLFVNKLFLKGKIMKYLLTGKQMQNADQYTIHEIGIPSMVLMERAAMKIVDIMEQYQLDFRKVLVVCGSGNNGGDGYAIARLLYLKGYNVSIYFAGNDEKRSEENRLQKKIADYYNIPVKQEIEKEEYSVIIDAIFGTGLSRDIEGSYYELIESLNQMSGYKVAVDTPSGLYDDTGKVMGIVFRADLTVAIAFAKRGQLIVSGNPYVGKLQVADIGIYIDAVKPDGKLTYCYEFDDFRERFPKRTANSHKGSYGKVLLIAGCKGMSGAALLCAKAAYATGAGLVQIYTHEDNRVIIQKSLPEAIVSTYTDYNEEQLKQLLEWADVVGIGCGLGMSDVADKLVRNTLQYADIPCVVDADALNLIANDITMLKNKEQPIVVTPHMKEMARLLSCSVKELQNQKMEYLERFVNQYLVTCVLKDARTLVSNDKENVFLNLTGNSAMAKGGSGDVLTGIISGIVAQKKDVYEAACLGVYLHGMAGDYARDQKGEYSVLAGDLVASTSEILKQL